MSTARTQENSTSSPLLELTLNEIVARHPKAMPVLNEFGLDTCCGGARTLREVTDRHGLDPQEILRRLEVLVAP
jgi:iron-sulfur cluster repair protein YtfE (RIC family)